MEPLSHDQFEDLISEAFVHSNADPTSDCIGEETLWEFAEQGGAHADAHRIIGHFASCMFCYQGYSRMLEFRQLSEARQPEASKILEQPAWKPTISFWNRVTEAIAASIEPIFPRQMAWQHANLDSAHEIDRQPLIFDDPKVVGSYIQNRDDYDVHIEHGTWRAGTLVLLESVTADHLMRFCRFYVLKAEWERAAIDTVIEASDITSCTLRLRSVRVANLLASEAPLLEFAFRSAIEFDPEVTEDWRKWAAKALIVTNVPEIQIVAKQIFAWPTATN